jgi:DNA mismatch endonuclease (patch repair protein)
MSAEKRSALMSRIRGRDTKPELAVARELRILGLRFRSHARDLPGRPDFVFRTEMVAIFVDGDFWHGWRLPAWRHKLTRHWEEKIARNRARDRRNRRALARSGWVVVRLWEHEVERDLAACIARVSSGLAAARAARCRA